MKNSLLEGPTLKRSFWWDGSFWILDGSSKLWCFEWNGILSIPLVWRRLSPHEERITHVSTLKTSTKKMRNWNGINSQPNGVHFQPNGVIFFGCFKCIFGLWHATYIFANVLQGVWISEKCEKCKNGSWPCKNPAKQLKRKFLAETAEISEATIISLAWAGGRNFTQPEGLGIYIYRNLAPTNQRVLASLFFSSPWRPLQTETVTSSKRYPSIGSSKKKTHANFCDLTVNPKPPGFHSSSRSVMALYQLYMVIYMGLYPSITGVISLTCNWYFLPQFASRAPLGSDDLAENGWGVKLFASTVGSRTIRGGCVFFVSSRRQSPWNFPFFTWCKLI